MAEQVAICACVKKSLVAFPAPLADGKRDGTVGISAFYGRDQGAQPLIVPVGILAALQNEGAKAQCVAGSAAGENLFLVQSVSVDVFAAIADTAVETVVFAVIG